jgi:hypothetical protein
MRDAGLFSCAEAFAMNSFTAILISRELHELEIES